MKIKFILVIVNVFLGLSVFGQRHFYYKFDTTKSNYENYESGYADTFSVKNIHFRIIARDSDLLIIQKFKNHQWQLVDSMPDCYQFDCEFVYDNPNETASANAPLDLYPYIQYFLDRDQYSCIFLYDTIAETFVKSGFWSFGADYVRKIKNNIYCDLSGGRYAFDMTWTTLYAIKNLKKYDLGITERIPQNYNSPIYDSTAKEEIILIKKINNDTELVTIDSFKIKNEKDFNELNYWKSNYTKFYPNEKSIPNIYSVFLDPYNEVEDYDNIDFKH